MAALNCPCIFTNFQALLFLLNKRYLDWPQTSCKFIPLSVGIFPPMVAFLPGCGNKQNSVLLLPASFFP